jgi:diphthamide synthase (EF-2-diphthine--ammonia ligase)
MIDAGVRARITCIDNRVLSEAFVGRDFDRRLLDELPTDVDPCGENGEFHTCVYAGPMFKYPVTVTAGERVRRDPFVWSDLLLGP